MTTAVRRLPLEDRLPTANFGFAGAELVCDWTGCLYWPGEDLLVVSDLHLEKGASLAARGQLVPPYDTGATLRLLADRLGHWRPARVVSLGDSFHEEHSSRRMPERYRAELAAMMAGRDWVWVAGNHDPAPPAGLGGVSCEELVIGAVTLRHAPRPAWSGPEIAGHLHPVARILRRGRSVRRRCFATDGRRLVMPSFGAYAGGLGLREPAFDGLFEEARLRAHVLGRGRVYTIAGTHLV